MWWIKNDLGGKYVFLPFVDNSIFLDNHSKNITCFRIADNENFCFKTCAIV